jgi:hypothetical protein
MNSQINFGSNEPDFVLCTKFGTDFSPSVGQVWNLEEVKNIGKKRDLRVNVQVNFSLLQDFEVLSGSSSQSAQDK